VQDSGANMIGIRGIRCNIIIRCSRGFTSLNLIFGVGLA